MCCYSDDIFKSITSRVISIVFDIYITFFISCMMLTLSCDLRSGTWRLRRRFRLLKFNDLNGFNFNGSDIDDFNHIDLILLPLASLTRTLL